MRALFAPAIAVCGRLRNIVKLPLVGLFFTLPLAVAVWVSPPAWGQAATWIMLGTYLFGFFTSPSAPVQIPGMAFFAAAVFTGIGLLLAIRTFAKYPAITPNVAPGTTNQ